MKLKLMLFVLLWCVCNSLCMDAANLEHVVAKLRFAERQVLPIGSMAHVADPKVRSGCKGISCHSVGEITGVDPAK